MTEKSVYWAELRPDDFRSRLEACPVVYLPMGLCEPHGHVAALGLDLIKADYYCDQAARRYGGIVAPSQGYHIHECGFHAPWLAEVVGEENPFLAGLPPHVMLHVFLYQLRAFANTGFKSIIAISGHSGGSQEDLRRVATVFSDRTGVGIVVKSDPEWVEGQYAGDHAGKYELSQLMAIRPELVDLKLIGRQHHTGSGGRLALGEDAAEATPEHGQKINEAILLGIGETVSKLKAKHQHQQIDSLLTYANTESMWSEIIAAASDWRCMSPYPDQPQVPVDSRWHPFARPINDFNV